MADRVDVFISSTSKDLTKYRERVIQALRKLGVDCIAMEEFIPSERNALQVCYDELCEADYFVGIYAYRYGYAPDETVTYKTEKGELRSGDGITGITHWEYQWAVEHGLPLFLFIVDSANDDETLRTHGDVDSAKSRFDAFKLQIGHDHVIGFFKNPDDLASQAVAAVGSYIIERPGRPKRSDSYQHIALPDNYVPRSDLLAELRLSLLGDTDSVALTSGIKAAPTALHGMGGIGKSVMARALCDDPAVQAAFPDGILWTTLGQEPNLVTKLREWVTALGGSIPENAPTEDSLKANLAGLLENRVCLLVVDDVWQRKHAEAFRVGGLKCRLLLTTRDAEIARAMNADVQSIPVMAEPEAVELLAEWGKKGLKEADDALKRQIVNRVGRLPLAVKLAGAQLQKKDPRKWLETFDARKLRINRPETVHDSLEKTFGLSLDALGQQERKLYAALVIFKEDEPVREVAIRRLWSALGHLDEGEVGDLVDDLGARALMDVVGGQYPRAVILHDLLRDFMAAELIDPVAMHQVLLDSYAQTRTGDGWHTAPDDGYLYDHLVFHLVAANNKSDLPILFATDDWMRARFDQSEYTYDGFIRDLMSAWELTYAEAERQIEAGEGAEQLAQCVHYALIRTTINSLAGNYVPELVARAVEIGLWSFRRGLSVAKNVVDPEKKAQLYIALLNTERGQGQQKLEAQNEGLASALTIHFGNNRAYALVNLVKHLTNKQKELAIASCLEAAEPNESDNESNYVYVLGLLAKELQGKQKDVILRQALSVTLGSLDYRDRADALIALAEQLSGDLLQAAIAAALALPKNPEFGRVNVLSALASQLKGEQKDKLLRQVLDEISIIKNEFIRTNALAALAVQLKGEQKDKLLRQVLDEISILKTGDFIDAFEAVISHISNDMLELGLNIALSLPNEHTYDGSPRIRALSAIADRLEGVNKQRALEQGLASALELPQSKDFDFDRSPRANAYRILARHLNDDMLKRGLTVALEIEDYEALVNVLITTAKNLEGAAKQIILEKGLEIALDSDAMNVNILVDLTEQLEGEAKQKGLEEALEVAFEISSDDVNILTRLAKQLGGEAKQSTLKAALEAALNTPLEDAWADNSPRVNALIKVTEQLDGEAKQKILRECLEIASQLQDDPIKLDALLTIAKQFKGKAKQKILRECLEIASQLQDDYWKINNLKALANHLTGEPKHQTLNQLVNQILKIEREESRITALIDALPLLEGNTKQSILKQVITIALKLEKDVSRATALTDLVKLLDGEQRKYILEQAITTSLRIEHDSTRAIALIGLVDLVDARQKSHMIEQAVITALKIKHVYSRADALSLLVGYQEPNQNRRNFIYHIMQLANEERDLILNFCTANKLYSSPTLTQPALERIGQSIIDICWNWRWQ